MSVIVKSNPRAISLTGPPDCLPFAHLNLCRNPFGELPLDQRAALAVVDVDRFVGRLKRPGYAVQFLGDKGRGKTTHLLAIRQHFPEAPYLHIGEGERPRIPRGHPLMIDEIQRLPRWRRRWVFRRPVSLVIGTHEDVSAELLRAGFEVDSIEAAAPLDAERLHEILSPDPLGPTSARLGTPRDTRHGPGVDRAVRRRRPHDRMGFVRTVSRLTGNPRCLSVI